MTIRIGNSQSANIETTNLQAQKKEKKLTNTAAENEAAINYLANNNPTNRSAELSKPSDEKTTVGDFLRKVKTEQPFDENILSKKEVKVIIEVKKPPAQTTLADYDKATW